MKYINRLDKPLHILKQPNKMQWRIGLINVDLHITSAQCIHNLDPTTSNRTNQITAVHLSGTTNKLPIRVQVRRGYDLGQLRQCDGNRNGADIQGTQIRASDTRYRTGGYCLLVFANFICFGYNWSSQWSIA
jgi:hypothetical protein